MELILLEKVQKLGDLGDKVNVKPGYGRNYLVPTGKAAPATATNIAEFEARRAELEKAALTKLSTAEERVAALEGFEIVLTANASEEGKLYGSIGPREISDAVSGQGIPGHQSGARLMARITADEVIGRAMERVAVGASGKTPVNTPDSPA